MGMREKMARAIGDALYGDADPATCPNNYARALSAVDAGLAAIYEPTNDVVIAMCTSDGGSAYLGHDEERRALRTWQRGVKAIRAGK